VGVNLVCLLLDRGFSLSESLCLSFSNRHIDSLKGKGHKQDNFEGGIEDLGVRDGDFACLSCMTVSRSTAKIVSF